MTDDRRAVSPAGAFLAIEGGDGAGKGTVLAHLERHLRRLDIDILLTREPGGTPEGQALRTLLLRTEGEAWAPWAELLLMTAARVQHVERVIRPAIAAGRVVVSDRFAGSTIAYQGAGRGLSVDAIEQLHRQAMGDFWPGLTVLLDLDPAIGLRRSRHRLSEQDSDEGRFEALDLAFHRRVRASFLAQAENPARTHVVVDASRPPEAVAEAVCQAVQGWLARIVPLG